MDDGIPVTPTPEPELQPQIICVSPNQPGGCVGGNAANVPGPSIALVTFNSGSSCTGTLVAPQWVITAAHCLVAAPGVSRALNDVATYRVYVGVPNGASPTSVTARMADQLVLSPGYLQRPSAEDVPGFRRNDQSWSTGTANLANDPGLDDYGLIHVTTPTTGIAPIPLAIDDQLAQSGLISWGAGYGYTNCVALLSNEDRATPAATRRRPRWPPPSRKPRWWCRTPPSARSPGVSTSAPPPTSATARPRRRPARATPAAR